MRRSAYASGLILLLATAPAQTVQAQSGFVGEARGACAGEVAAVQKYFMEMQGLTAAEADDSINSRMDGVSTLPRYAVQQMADRIGDEPTYALQSCGARLRLNQLIAAAPLPLAPEQLAAARATARSRCIGNVPALKAFLSDLTEAQYGPLIDNMVDQMGAMGAAERDKLLGNSGEDDPSRPLSQCIAGVVIGARADAGALVAAAPEPSTRTPGSNRTGATPQQIAAAEARNAQARDVGARQRAESDAFTRDAAIQAGKIYQSNGPDGGQIALHPTTGQRCVTAVLGPTEPYGGDGVVHVIEFTNVCDKIFRIRARIIPLGPISDTSGGVQGTGIGAGSLNGPNKGRLICIQKPNREVGTCSGFTEWWVS